MRDECPCSFSPGTDSFSFSTGIKTNTCRRENITKKREIKDNEAGIWFLNMTQSKKKPPNMIQFARATSTICINVSLCCLILQGQTSHIAIALPLAKTKKRRKNEKVLKYSNPPGIVEGRACCGVIKMNNLHSVTFVNGTFECAVCGGGQSCAFICLVLQVWTSLFTRKLVLSAGKDAEVINNGSCVIKHALGPGQFNSGF